MKKKLVQHAWESCRVSRLRGMRGSPSVKGAGIGSGGCSSRFVWSREVELRSPGLRAVFWVGGRRSGKELTGNEEREEGILVRPP